ncbi:hypothetical protein EON65_52255 [archaeon]|nr:MAG: hypothetical protein EON65_52255 [archaeon]
MADMKICLKVSTIVWSLVWFLLLVQVNSMPGDSYRLYDKDISKFSSEGRLMQVDYARKAGMRGNSQLAASIAVAKEIVLVAPTTKKLQILEENTIADKVMRIDENSVLAVSGLAGDGRYVAAQLRAFSLSFWNQFGSLPSTVGLAKVLGGLQHEANLKGGKCLYLGMAT